MTFGRGYLCPVLTVSRLQELLGEHRDWIVVRPTGEPVDTEIPPDIGPATLLVSTMTDALKTVSEDGFVDGSLDRESVWKVEAIALNRVVVSRLEGEEMSPLDLYRAVIGLRLGWQIAAMPGEGVK